MSATYRALRSIVAHANEAMNRVNGQTVEGRVARKYLDMIGNTAARELSKTPLAKMKRK